MEALSHSLSVVTNRRGVDGLLNKTLNGCIVENTGKDIENKSSARPKTVANKQVQTARIMANGDLLYHDALYMSALREDGSYDFSENFQYAKEWLHQADLTIGDFEGTISPDLPLAGYPLFNAPESVVGAIKDAGYHVLDLAHNHILDSQLSDLPTA